VPKIYDNIDDQLLPDLQAALGLATHADFCVGYFNLRGWRRIDARVRQWDGGPGAQCRLLVGMHPSPREELRAAFSGAEFEGMDNATAIRLKQRLAAEFHQQLTLGVPTDDDEAGLRRLTAPDREAVYDHVRRVLAINESAGEKGIPAAVKARFPRKRVDGRRERGLLQRARARVSQLDAEAT
jgi:hypothetical protein